MQFLGKENNLFELEIQVNIFSYDPLHFELDFSNIVALQSKKLFASLRLADGLYT